MIGKMRARCLRFAALTLSLIMGCCPISYADGDGGSLIPAQAPGFGGSITGLLLQPNSKNLEYAIYTKPLPLPAPNWYQLFVKPSYQGAFDLEAKYNFSGKNNQDQLKLDWLYFNNKDTASFNPTQPGTTVGPIYYFGPLQQFLLNTFASSTATFKLNDVKLVYGHFMNLSDNIQIEPYFGIDFVNLKENISSHYQGADPVEGPYFHDTYLKSNYTGFGPRVRLDGLYYLTTHFGVGGRMAGSVFAGNQASSTKYLSWTGSSGVLPRNNIPVVTTLASQNIVTVIPEVDSEIGLFYTTPFGTDSTLSLEVGYMFMDYVDAFYQVLPSEVVPGDWELGTVAVIGETRLQSSFSLNGPFIRLTLK